MKQKLWVLAITTLSFGAIQTSGATEVEVPMDYALAHSVTTFGSLENTYRNTNISSDDELSEAIKNLTAQAQDKEKNLSSLAEKLAQQPKSKPQAPVLQARSQSSKFSSNRKSSRRVLDSNSAPAIAAARAARAAHSRSTGRCARYVRQALQAAGYQFTPNESAYQYASLGTLSQAGFVKISNNTPPQVGDVVVFNRSSKHRHGHIQIYDGSQWVSDFRQDDINPYSGSYSYTTWRDARYLDDASDKGIYLAMAE